MDEKSDLELIRMYQHLYEKRKAGKFSYASAIGFAAISAALESRGYVLLEDKTTWVQYT